MTTDERIKFFKLRKRLAISGLVIFFLCYWIYNLKIDIQDKEFDNKMLVMRNGQKDTIILSMKSKIDSFNKTLSIKEIPIDKPKLKVTKKDTTKIEVKLDTLPRLDTVPKIQDTTQTL